MKRQAMIVLGGAMALIICSNWIPGEQAEARTSIKPLIPAESRIDLPLGQRCVVTVDPQAASKPVIAGTANIVTGFVAPDAVVGILIRMDTEWVVLLDGRDENWIPINKVLMIHAYD